MADTTGRIPLWIIGTITGILVAGLIGFYSVQSVPTVEWYASFSIPRFFLLSLTGLFTVAIVDSHLRSTNNVL